MGIYIYLSIILQKITQEQWGKVYEESLKFLDNFPFMDIVKREKNGKQYHCGARSKSEQIKSKYNCFGWNTIGDMISCSATENFGLYNDLREYQYYSNTTDNNSDALLTLLPSKNKCNLSESAAVFCDKTQGRPIHIPLLSVACMIVDMLPEGSAVVYGDINIGQ